LRERDQFREVGRALGSRRLMRTLLVTHYFPPEIGAPQARLSEMAGRWAEVGDDVTVLTGMPNHPTGVVPPAYRHHLRTVEQMDDYRVVRTWLYATPNEGFIKKTLGHLSFMVTSLLFGARISGRADVVVVSSPTFFSVFSAWALARLKRVPLVVEVRDLWPAIFVELGVLTNRHLIRVLERLELWIYGQATKVVVVSEGFRENLIGRGVPASKVETIRNGADLTRFAPGGDPAPGRKRLGATNGELLVLYIGAHGLSHGLESVVDAADLLSHRPIRLAMVGEGARRNALVADVKARGLSNVTMLPGVTREEVPSLLAAADVCLVPLRDVPLFSTFIPSKLFEFLAAGKPVVGALRGEAAGILRDAGAIVVEPGDAQALADAIDKLADDPAWRSEMGWEGHRYVSNHFDRVRLADRYRTLLVDCVRTG
jgi:glycosyltransferase involved in cell wall biosynthesis